EVLLREAYLNDGPAVVLRTAEPASQAGELADEALARRQPQEGGFRMGEARRRAPAPAHQPRRITRRQLPDRGREEFPWYQGHDDRAFVNYRLDPMEWVWRRCGR